MTMSCMRVVGGGRDGEGSLRCGMRDACTRGGFCHRRSATKPLSGNQARRCSKVQPGGEEEGRWGGKEEVLARLEMGQSRAGVFVSVLRTHARTHAGLEGTCWTKVLQDF